MKVVKSTRLYLAQVLWPAHCVQESWGAELHKELKVHPKGRVVHKGINPEVDSYSAFFDNAKLGKTSLEEMIKEEEVSDVYVCGIATDVCVGTSIYTLHFRYCHHHGAMLGCLQARLLSMLMSSGSEQF